ncbi:hypothetical protein F5X99DRAFT_395221 [Biscogniauxia marginata]|nr:hypothetical protein F5X99DRAFT_395221 [Biscogniauxia marginata]
MADVKHIAIVDRLRHHSSMSYISSHICRWVTVGLHRATFSLICTIVTIHVSPRQVRESGLFGYREGQALVNVRDSAKLARYSHFYETYSQPRNPRISQLLAMLSRPEGVERYVSYEMEDMKDMWLLVDYLNKPEHSHKHEDLIQGKHRSDRVRKAYWDTRRWYYSVFAAHMVCDRNTEWAQKRLAKIPDFQLLIMFRICNAHVCNAAVGQSQAIGVDSSHNE